MQALRCEEVRGTLTPVTAKGGNLVTETPPGGGPTVLRMLLARQLQALREKAGMTYEQAAEAIYSSPWTIRRMERAEGGLKPLTVKSLLMAYGITDVREIDAFLALARDASKPGWWHNYDDVLPSWFRTAVGLEESASLIRSYQPQVIPGLLQTEGYIRAITAASFPAAAEEETERRVALRLARQELLRRRDPPEYWVVMDETVLRRSIGGQRVMREQLAYLIEAIRLPKVTIQVIPFAAGWHPALYGMFNVYRFPAQELPDVVYSESLTGAFYLSKPEEAARYTEALDQMCAQAASPEQTITILRDIMKEI
jgi:transcriptional regulator with XRE-family HTH domain